MFVLERADDDKNEIDERPDTQTAQRDDLQYAGSDLADINRCAPNTPRMKHSKSATSRLLGLAPGGAMRTPVGAPQCGQVGARLEMI